MQTTKLTSKGQVVIPKSIREIMHIMAGTEFKVTLDHNRIVLETLRVRSHRLNDWPGFKTRTKKLSNKEAFAPVEYDRDK